MILEKFSGGTDKEWKLSIIGVDEAGECCYAEDVPETTQPGNVGSVSLCRNQTHSTAGHHGEPLCAS